MVEDEEALALLLKYNLEKEGYEVIWESSGNKALAAVEKYCPSVILLDWMLPELSGVDICKMIRNKPDIKDIPIIMLTAKGEEEDKIKGLSAGADDYVTKPFSVPELMARVKTNLRRAPELLPQKNWCLKISAWICRKKGFSRRQIYSSRADRIPVAADADGNAGKGLFARVFAKNVWGSNIYVESRTVDVHIRRLRKSLNEFGPDYIRTVRANRLCD